MLFLICRKLIGQQMVNGTEVLKWLREILICRNKFLLKNKVQSHVSHQVALLVTKRVSRQVMSNMPSTELILHSSFGKIIGNYTIVGHLLA